MQCQEFTAEVFLLPLESYDLILEIQWLRTLGTMQWNFAELKMAFELNGREHILRGEQPVFGGILNVLHLKQVDWHTMDYGPFHNCPMKNFGRILNILLFHS